MERVELVEYVEVGVAFSFVSDEMHAFPVEVIVPDLGGVNEAVALGIEGLDEDAALGQPILVPLLDQPVLCLEEVPGEVGGDACDRAADRFRLVRTLVVLLGDEDRVAAQPEGVLRVPRPEGKTREYQSYWYTKLLMFVQEEPPSCDSDSTLCAKHMLSFGHLCRYSPRICFVWYGWNLKLLYARPLSTNLIVFPQSCVMKAAPERDIKIIVSRSLSFCWRLINFVRLSVHSLQCRFPMLPFPRCH